ncbi:LIM domain [Popillia japonica]|uniref:LIM domain n=1 Tax=Popillia japonica TaxID=7064 RepID=A0AAW1JGK7_POPJA
MVMFLRVLSENKGGLMGTARVRQIALDSVNDLLHYRFNYGITCFSWNCIGVIEEEKKFSNDKQRKLFGTKCDKCGSSFSKNDFVMRAKSKIYHIECFRCAACAKQLVPGDEFALRDGGLLYCKEDHDVMEKTSAPTTPHPGQESNNNTSLSNNNHSNNSTELGCMSDSGSESGSHKGGGPRKNTSASGDGKPTRVRTVLNEKQLHTLRTCYAANPRPDALMKEQLVEMTGLSPRVIRVWFQNKRCKDKKKTILMKQQMQQEKHFLKYVILTHEEKEFYEKALENVGKNDHDKVIRHHE